MSKFKTTIPISVAAVLAKLPARSYVEGTKLNEARDGVEVIWGCDDLRTGYTFPVEFPLANLEAGSRPQGVLDYTNVPPPADAKPVETAAVNDKVEVDTGKKGGRKGKT